MKKYFSYLSIFAMLLLVNISVSSCDEFDFGKKDNTEKKERGNKNNEDNDDESDGSSNNDGGNGGGNNDGGNGGDNNDGGNGGGNGGGNNDDIIGGSESDKVYKDKEDFQRIALEIRNEFNASDFENILELAEYISKEYAEYDTENAENWFGKCMESLWKEIESNNNYEVYEAIYKLSAFKGKWVANERTHCWERTNANNLSVNVKDQYGNPCEITLTTSGNTKKVHCFDSQEKNYNGYYDYENGVWVENITYGDIEKIYVEVPEKISVVLKQNGYRLAEIIINTDLSSMSGVDYNLATDKYDVNASIYFNGYSLNLENAYYENKKESKVIASFKHGNKTLLSASLTATPEILVSNFDEDWGENDFNSKNNVLSIKILNKLELIGTCNNLKSLADVLNEEYNENTDSKVNRYLKINAYFYGAKEPTATIKFESEEDGYYDYWEGKYIYDYDLIPVIEFQDYSRHSLEDFFNEEDFEKTINAFESLFNQFEDLLRGYDFDF